MHFYFRCKTIWLKYLNKVPGDSFTCTLDQFQWRTAKGISQLTMCSTAAPVKAETPSTVLFGFVFPQRSRHFFSSLSSHRPQTLPFAHISQSPPGRSQFSKDTSANNVSKVRWRTVACCNYIRAWKHYSLKRSREFPNFTVQNIPISTRIYNSSYVSTNSHSILTLLMDICLGGFN